MSKSPAYFDQHKLDWMNAEYIKKTPIDDITDRIMELINEGQTNIAKALQMINLPNLREFIKSITRIYQHNVFKLTDIMEKVYFYANVANETFDYSGFSEFPRADVLKVLTTFEDEIASQGSVLPSKIDYAKLIKMVGSETGITRRELYFPLNITFTGGSSAPEIDQILGLYSVSTVMDLTKRAISSLQSKQYS